MGGGMFSLHTTTPLSRPHRDLEHEPGIPTGFVHHGDDQSPIHLYVIAG
jgi:hypothetical protein